MQINTKDLKGKALDWAVALAAGYDEDWLRRQMTNPNQETRAIPRFSEDWGVGGPLIEEGKIRLDPRGSEWQASFWAEDEMDFRTYYSCKSVLEAAMRCYVGSKLGEQVNVPKELQ